MDKTVTFTVGEAKKYYQTDEHKENIKKLTTMKDEDIDYTNIPEIDENFFKNAEVVYTSNP